MPLIINTNLSSLIAQRNLTVNTNSMNKSLEKLSSGYRINHAADDPAGLIISEQLRSQIRGQKQALQNAQDGVSILQQNPPLLLKILSETDGAEVEVVKSMRLLGSTLSADRSGTRR